VLDLEVFKPIRNLGVFLEVIGAAGVAFHLAYMREPQYPIEAQVFVVFLTVFYLVIGWNIVSRNRWGFRSLKLILYLLYPGFPLGYYFAKRTLRYIEHHNIERYFKRSIEI